MPAQIEALRAKIDCSRKQLTNDAPNWKRQFVGPDEGVAYSSVYCLNLPISSCFWQQFNISADHLLIYGEKSEGRLRSFNTCMVHFHQLLERSRAYFFAMRRKAGEMVLRRQCGRTSCLRLFAQIEDVHSSSLMCSNMWRQWSMATGGPRRLCAKPQKWQGRQQKTK